MEPGASAVPEGESSLRVARVAEVVRRWCIADANVTVYGLSHPLAVRSIQEVHGALTALLHHLGGSLSISISEDSLLFEGFPVETRNAQVARLCRRLGKLHVTTLRFVEGLTLEEMTALHELLAMREEEIERHGGVRSLLELAGVRHIAVSSAQYVLIEEDQRVVARDAVVSAQGGSPRDRDADLARYVAEELLKAGRDKAWLLTRLKNDPRGMAALVAEGIGKVLDGSVDPEREQETIRSLIENIRLVGRSLMDEETGTLREGEEHVKDALLELETEIQNRARQLMSGAEATRFVNELLQVITTYSDQVKARRITREFLKGEANLKTTERLLRQMAGKRETGEELLVRLRDLMLKEGLKEEDLHTLLRRVQRRRTAPARSRPLEETLRRGIVQRIQSAVPDADRQEDVAQALTAYFTDKLAERERVLTQAVEKAGQATARREQVLEMLAGCGVVIWDGEGRIEYVNEPAHQALQLEPGFCLGAQVMAALAELEFPLAVVTPDEAAQRGWSPEGYRLLLAIHRLVRDRRGQPVGALLMAGPGRQASPAPSAETGPPPSAPSPDAAPKGGAGG